MNTGYYSLNSYLKNTFGHKLYKLSLDGGMTCPNRDGTIGTGGCIFCSEGGSGDFTGKAYLDKHNTDCTETRINKNTALRNVNSKNIVCRIIDCIDIDRQIEASKKLISSKYNGNNGYIAYFQSYTNTYADTAYLEQLFTHVCMRDDIRVLSIATRPDCISDNTLCLLKRLNQIKPVWIELGLQTIHESSAAFIRRSYPLSVFDETVKKLNLAGIKTIVHMIIGLPGESHKMILETADYIGHCNVFGIKLQLLHVLKNTDLADYYYKNQFETLTLDNYIKCLAEIIELLPPDIVIHRLTGDGPKKLLIAPEWSANKKKVLNSINKYFSDNNICQGRNYI